MIWLRRQREQGHRALRHRQSARKVARRCYRPLTEWLEERTVLSPAPALPLPAPLGPVAHVGNHVVTLSKSSSPAPAVSKQFADLTALLFAFEIPDLPAVHLPVQPTSFRPLVTPQKVGVYPVPTASPTPWTGTFGGVVPDSAGAENTYQVFFLPASNPEKSLWLQATAGRAYHGEVVTMVLPGNIQTVTDYQATIDWGDGSVATTGTIHVTGKQAGVDGQHIYLYAGRFPVQVHIQVDGKSLGDVKGTATVVPATPPVGPPASRRDTAPPKVKSAPLSMRSPRLEGWAILSVAVGLFRSSSTADRR
jgi:hypothetical protein